jgi:hypothetical protein
MIPIRGQKKGDGNNRRPVKTKPLGGFYVSLDKTEKKRIIKNNECEF